MRRLPRLSASEQRDALMALNDLRAEAGGTIMALLEKPGFPHVGLAVEVLAWSSEPRVGSWLREWTLQQVPLLRRAQRRRRSLPPRRPSVPADVPYRECSTPCAASRRRRRSRFW